MTLSSTGQPSTIAVAALALSLERLREPVRQGTTAPLAWRLQQLEGMAELLNSHEQAVLDALAADLGKPPVEAYFELVAVRQELKLAQRRLRRWMAPRNVSLPLSQRPGRAQLIAEPLGCVLIIGPWNYPFSLSMQPLVSALAAGNTAVLKPSEHAPRTSALIAELAGRHLDPAAVAVVEGDGDTARQLLEMRFDHIFFTGGGRVGRLVMAAAARHLTPVTLELGGKSPAVVLGDADLAVTARRIAWGKGLNAGQTCIAPDHLLVEEAVRPALISALEAEFLRAYGPDPLRSPDLARIVNRGQFERLSALLEGARQRGQILAGGQSDPESLRIAPTLLAVDQADDPLMAEELFGPLLPVLSVPSLAAAIARINDAPKPLALYLFSQSLSAQETLLAGTSSGGVCFNDVVMQVGVPELPFGGVGASGMGNYHGKAGFDTFSHHRSVLRRPFRFDLPFRYPPYGDRLGLIKRLLG
ncbi:aldehyde dehydrogenase family protein [Synechococcus sp. CS-603]|uniref:aldehyde dehydrogenase family protein n=1 Tax=Synechococcus sp. CS-603 TaxID=2847981 RepID=UPI00223BC05A|nr:aldehyde dehydrogenase family protein [Synechococcus sp. CS-603]MCT0201180.1 aldehyde dehydrogenase family protein [Synechococcus sp. CS-603]